MTAAGAGEGIAALKGRATALLQLQAEWNVATCLEEIVSFFHGAVTRVQYL